MLDLSKQKKYYQIKWFNGEVLHIPLPTQEMLMNMDNIMELINSDKAEDQMEGNMEFIKYITSLNKDKIVLKDEDYKDLDLNLINMIITDYYNFTVDVLGE